jgi:hypothetical protein
LISDFGMRNSDLNKIEKLDSASRIDTNPQSKIPNRITPLLRFFVIYVTALIRLTTLDTIYFRNHEKPVTINQAF